MSNTTTTTPMIDSIRKRRAEGTFLEENVCAQLLMQVRKYRDLTSDAISETRWVEKQMVGVRARLVDGHRVPSQSLSRLETLCEERQLCADKIRENAFLLELTVDDLDALFDEIEAEIREATDAS